MDVDNDGLTDLLAVVPLAQKFQVYRQRKSGYAATPDQTIALPEHTAWIASYDVDAHPGKELLFSTAAGFVYLRQNDGVFEQSPRTLIEAQQVFLTPYPRIMPEPAKPDDANEVLAIVSADHAVLYEKDEDYQWRRGRNMDLHMAQSFWQRQYLDWMAGPNRSHTVSIRTTFRTDYDQDLADEEKAKDAAIRKLLDDIRAKADWDYHGVKNQDVNGDGREDLVLWKSRRDMSPKTTVLVFIRGQDNQLPRRPTHVLRGSGVPIHVKYGQGVSPMWDLDGDGKCELVLVTLKTSITSWSGLVSIALSGGVDWIFTVRSGRDGDYSGGPDFQMDMTSRTPTDRSVEWMFLIDGDFNGDGQEDILLERSSDQYDVYLSDADTGFFRKEPPLSFKAPVEAWTRITDLNSDGISDLLVRERRVSRVTVFLSQSEKPKGTQ